MLVVKDLSKKLGEHEVLKNINFTLPSHGVTALLGPNGAGKTTLMRCMIGFYSSDNGEIKSGDFNLVDNRKEIAASISYVPETGGLYPEMSVFEYIKFMAEIKHVPSTQWSKDFSLLIKELELDDVLKQKCETLSKGFSRRVAIAGALISNPKLLILDEPCEGLDIKQKVNLRAFLKKRSRHCAILISTHIMEDVEALADRILVLMGGNIICDTTPDELKNKTRQINIEDSFFTFLKGEENNA